MLASVPYSRKRETLEDYELLDDSKMIDPRIKTESARVPTIFNVVYLFIRTKAVF